MRRLINYLKSCIKICLVLSKETGNSVIYTLYDCIYALIRHGCLVKQYYYGGFYKQKEYIRKRAMTQRRLEKIISTYNDNNYIHLLENKNEFNTFFDEYVHRKWLYSNDMKKSDFMKLIENTDSIIIKPMNSQEGFGIQKLSTKEIDYTNLFDSLKTDKYMIEETVVQDNAMNFGNASLNTIRIITFVGNDDKVHIIRAGLRVGIGDSIVDNFTQGGVLYNIDVSTGIIIHPGISHTSDDIIYHPGTDIKMLGLGIPKWDEVVLTVQKAASQIPQVRFIGWDIAITSSDIELIEGNHNPGLFTMESLGSPGSFYDIMKFTRL